MSTVLTAGRNLIARRRGRDDDGVRVPRLTLFAIGSAALIAGYVLGRRAAEPEHVGAPSAVSTPPAEPPMEMATAVEVSRPQPAELDEIVPAAGATT